MIIVRESYAGSEGVMMGLTVLYDILCFLEGKMQQVMFE